MIEEDLTPDIPAEQLLEYATLPQQLTVEKVQRMGWNVSHLWRRDEGDICIWLIARALGHDRGYSFAFINPDGSLGRYQPPKVRIAGRRKSDED